MKKIIFITPRDAEYGFSLAGITQLVADEGGVVAAVQEAVGGEDSGLVILDERLLQELGEERLAELEGEWQGLILMLPSPEMLPPEEEDYAARLIRRAIGYHVRLNV